jgi:hypothetical protein
LSFLSAAEYNFSAAPVKAHDLTVTGTFYLVSGTDTISSWTTATVCSTALAGDLRGTWKTRDTTYFGVLARASTWTGRQTFADLVTGDSTKTVTLDASGKVTASTGVVIGTGGSYVTKGAVGGNYLYFIVGIDSYPITKLTH